MFFRLLRALARRPNAPPADWRTVVRSARVPQYRRDFSGAARLLEQSVSTDASRLLARDRASLLIEFALCQMRRNLLQEGARALEQARLADPDHPLIDQLALFPRLLGERIVLSQGPLAPAEVTHSPTARPVTAVYFFLETPGTTPKAHAGYQELMRGSIHSLRAAVPEARAVLITNQATRVPAEAPFDAILRKDLDSSQLVFSRLLALSRMLDNEIRGDLVLLDPDTTVSRYFRGVFAAPFDLAFTLRSDFADTPMDHEPLNVGVIFVRAEGTARARRFFELCLEHFPDIESRPSFRAFYPGGLRAWRGDQVLPAALVGWQEFHEHVLSGRTNRMEVAGCTVAFLESALYNCRPEAAASDTPFITHFKGDLKKRALRQPTHAA